MSVSDDAAARGVQKLVRDLDNAEARIRSLTNSADSLRSELQYARKTAVDAARVAERRINDLTRRCGERTEAIERLQAKFDELLGLADDMKAADMSPAERLKALRALSRLRKE